MSDEAKAVVMEFLEKNSAKGKKKIYPKDLAKLLEDKMPRSESKKAIQELLNEQKLAYWSSGSTTYVMLMKDFQELKEKEEG